MVIHVGKERVSRGQPRPHHNEGPRVPKIFGTPTYVYILFELQRPNLVW